MKAIEENWTRDVISYLTWNSTFLPLFFFWVSVQVLLLKNKYIYALTICVKSDTYTLFHSSKKTIK